MPFKKSAIAAFVLCAAFTGAASAQEQNCKARNLIQYDIKNKGQTLQSRGAIASKNIGGEKTVYDDGEEPVFEIYGNSDTLEWTMIEVQDEKACIYKIGGIFFNEKDREEDGTKTLRQSAHAFHGYGDANNEAFELFVHEGTGRWAMSRRISEIESKVILAGDNYEEFNLPPHSAHTTFVSYEPSQE